MPSRRISLLGSIAWLALLVGGCGDSSPPAVSDFSSPARDLSAAAPDLAAAKCVDDKGCSGDTPRCDVMSGRCVACLGDDQCAMGMLCRNGLCASGCSANKGCGDAGVCDVDAGVCKTCNSDAECGGQTPRCDMARRICVACLPANDNCGGGQVCTLVNGTYTCAKGCKSDAECAAADGGNVDSKCCNGVCASTSGDAANCGACGKACEVGKSCCASACVDGQADVMNCGACGNACKLDHGSAVCTAGKCAIDKCELGYADCDQSAVNGCEVNTAADPKNCQSCGKVCNTPNGTPACNNGCVVATCDQNRADCDKMADNGCEVDTATTLAHCGGCGMACGNVANGTAACAMGKCGIAACDGAFKDCDADAKNGCEVDTASTLAHCGGCGMACGNVANGTAACAMGKCGIGACNGAFKDCDKMVANGCEADTGSDENHCSDCGMVCPKPPNGNPVCLMGKCGVGSCNAPQKDCDKNPANGCEVDTSADAKNCGDCGTACTVANGAPSCVASKCAVASCNAGFGNCDMNPANGCETKVADDPKNCGACGKVCAMGQECCNGNCVGPPVVNDGSLTDGTDLLYQYTSVAANQGAIKANWAAVPGADSYEIAVGTTKGGVDVAAYRALGKVTNSTVTGLTLKGAWAGGLYFVTVRAVCGAAKLAAGTSDGVRIAEAETWDGTLTGLRPPDGSGGHNNNWPTNGQVAIYGAHYFETVNIPQGRTVAVQGWGKVDNVGENMAANDPKVTAPKDGWLDLQANNITLGGTITASGRGYGGGGAGGGTCGALAERGHGGTGGLGGRGGSGNSNGCAGGGAGGGGSPFGSTGAGCTPGGQGNLLGGGGGGTGQWGCQGGAYAGGAGGVGSGGGPAGGSSDIGHPGTRRSPNQNSAGGAGEFAAGGGGGGSGCPAGCSGGAGGGGGYGAGGGGGNESWAGGGGGGGSGGFGGGNNNNGLPGAGPFAGDGGGGANGSPAGNGQAGGYAAKAANGDATNDRSLRLGSGGGGGGASESQSGGGGGAAGGGYVKLYAANTLLIAQGARVLANGAGGGGGAGDDNDQRYGGQGGNGAGGGLLFEGKTLTIQATGTNISARGGGASKANGGTIKLFYGAFNGTKPTEGGRIYDAGANSWLLSFGGCIGNPQWQPVTCKTGSWVWSRDRAKAKTQADAATQRLLATGCNHGQPQPDLANGVCSLDGTGWVSTQTFTMQGCDANWYHLGGSFTGNCGGHDGDKWRHLVLGVNDCYPY